MIILLTSLDDPVMAGKMARQLVESRLAACVQISNGVESIYRWQGKTDSATESVLTIKTTSERLQDLISWLQRHHPYDLPELVWWQTDADRSYAAWAGDSVRLNDS